MPSRRVVAFLLASAALVVLSGCTAGASQPDDTATVTTPQADISGEWVVTRTVTASNDPTNATRAVGATSVRYVLVERDDCGAALCDGTVSSGATLEDREETALTQTDGGFDYGFTGSLDCMNAATGGVLVVDGFAYEQTASLTLGETSEGDGVTTAATLTGTITYSDTVTGAATENGCTRDPLAVEVTYAVAATRAPVG
ncbi:hypothetical protein GCM10027413_17450 [Conyzicola nivalis]|uniref:Lipocalin-like domain-containing protein n=1 Tax=Conyzicola nivalis TaxID=1477021 RepID=A0A916SEZ0_9MICO|nr:hypothetical protein [Conyzicola nivalis]GGA96891.1 hypothetical protein GCM10010979_09170 [Conyzicola nivalis]